MKRQRKLTNKEWAEILKKGPGVHNYRGKRTLFYNGEILWDGDWSDNRPIVYHEEERQTWEVIIVLPGVEVIPENTFCLCMNIEAVIMADSVRRLRGSVFSCCIKLSYVRLSNNLEFIGYAVFDCCDISSIFIPPSCREIGLQAFSGCKKLKIFVVHQQTALGRSVFRNTGLIHHSTFDSEYDNDYEVNAWVKNINGNNGEYALHRACAAFNPLEDVILDIVRRKGMVSFQKENIIQVTPLQYLEENPFADIDQQKLMRRYILEMMGETV